MEKTKYGRKNNSKAKLEKWPNPHPDRDYTIDSEHARVTYRIKQGEVTMDPVEFIP